MTMTICAHNLKIMTLYSIGLSDARMNEWFVLLLDCFIALFCFSGWIDAALDFLSLKSMLSFHNNSNDDLNSHLSVYVWKIANLSHIIVRWTI